MPVSHHVDSDHKILLSIWEGEFTDDNSIVYLDNYRKKYQLNPEYTDYNEILDLTHADPFKLTMRGLLAISSMASDAENKNNIQKFALVVNSDIAMNFRNLYIFYRNLSRSRHKKIKLFRDKSQAQEWVMRD